MYSAIPKRTRREREPIDADGFMEIQPCGCIKLDGEVYDPCNDHKCLDLEAQVVE